MAQLPLRGAIATFGYSLAWSSVLAASGLIVGRHVFSTVDWSFQGAASSST